MNQRIAYSFLSLTVYFAVLLCSKASASDRSNNPDGLLWRPSISYTYVSRFTELNAQAMLPVANFLSLGLKYERSFDYFRHPIQDNQLGYSATTDGYNSRNYVSLKYKCYLSRIKKSSRALLNPDGDLYWPYVEGSFGILNAWNDAYEFALMFPVKAFLTFGLGVEYSTDYYNNSQIDSEDDDGDIGGGAYFYLNLHSYELFHRQCAPTSNKAFWPKLEYSWGWVRALEGDEEQNHLLQLTTPINSMIAIGIGFQQINDCYFYTRSVVQEDEFIYGDDMYWMYEVNRTFLLNMNIRVP